MALGFEAFGVGLAGVVAVLPSEPLPVVALPPVLVPMPPPVAEPALAPPVAPPPLWAMAMPELTRSAIAAIAARCCLVRAIVVLLSPPSAGQRLPPFEVAGEMTHYAAQFWLRVAILRRAFRNLRLTASDCRRCLAFNICGQLKIC